MAQNGGSAEYAILINSLTTTGDKVDTVSNLLAEEFAKQSNPDDVNNPLNLMLGALLPVVGTSFVNLSNLSLPGPGGVKTVVDLEAFRKSLEATYQLQEATEVAKTQASNSTKKGLSGILNFLKANGVLIAKITVVVAALAAVAARVWQTFDVIGSSVSTLYEEKAALEVKVGNLEGNLSKISQQVNNLNQAIIALQLGLIVNENVAQNAAKTSNQTKAEVQKVKQNMENLRDLIIANHKEVLGEFKGLNDVIILNFKLNAEWQRNNGAEPTSTLVKATIERPNGMLDKLQKQVTTATEGVPEIAENDGDYILALATGSASPFGTIGYSGFKNTQGLKKQISDATEGVPPLAEQDIDYVLALAGGDAVPGGSIGYTSFKNLTAVKRQISTATEGHPDESKNDADYNAAVAAGGIIGGGTIGYAIFKNRDFLFKKMKKIGLSVNLGIILDLFNAICSIHNCVMLSREVLETLFSVVNQGLDAALNLMGVKDIDDEGVDSKKALGTTIDALGKQIFGVAAWTDLQAKWAAANRIVASGNTLLCSIREMGDTTGSLAAMAAENSGKVGNILRRSGVTKDMGAWFPENYTRSSAFGQRFTNFLEGANNAAQGFEQLTSSVLSIQQNASDIKENNEKFQKTLAEDAPKLTIPNKPVEEEAIAKKEASVGPEIKPEDTKDQDTGE